MDYNDVPLFVQVVEAGSFTRVASKLGVQRSSVSRAVARLEDDLGVRLLQRTTRKLGLTDAGQTFYERVRGAVAGVDEAASAVQELGSEPRGVVRITAPNNPFGLASIIARFIERHPSIRVELMLTGRVVDLVAEGFDLAVRAGPLLDSSLVARRVGSVEHALFAAPSYLEKQGRPKTLADLAKHDCVFFRVRGDRTTWSFTGPNGEESVEVTGKIGADDMTFLTSAAIEGLGIVILPIPVASAALEAGALELVLPQYRTAGSALYVVLPSAAFVPVRVALLRDSIVENLSKELAEAQRQCQKQHRSRAGMTSRTAVRRSAARRR